MPGKSRHGKRKHSFQKKRRKSKQHFPVTAAQPVAARAYKPGAPPRVSAPAAGAPTPKAALTEAKYPYIATELRRIGILAGITLVILVVLALVLPRLS